MRIHFFTAPFFSVNRFILPMTEKRRMQEAVSIPAAGHAKSMLLSEHAFYFANIIRPFR